VVVGKREDHLIFLGQLAEQKKQRLREELEHEKDG
jgi:hypothetical protein